MHHVLPLLNQEVPAVRHTFNGLTYWVPIVFFVTCFTTCKSGGPSSLSCFQWFNLLCQQCFLFLVLPLLNREAPAAAHAFNVLTYWSLMLICSCFTTPKSGGPSSHTCFNVLIYLVTNAFCNLFCHSVYAHFQSFILLGHHFFLT